MRTVFTWIFVFSLVGPIVWEPDSALGSDAVTQNTAPVTDGVAQPVTAPETLAAAPVSEPAVAYKASCEAGFTLTEGNTSNRILASACNTSREDADWLVGFLGSLKYGKNRFGGPVYFAEPGHREVKRPRGDFILTENHFLASIRETRFLLNNKSQYVFLIQGVEGDQFKGFWFRVDLQAGYGYGFYASDEGKLSAEAGVQYDRDNLVLPNANHNQVEERIGGVISLVGEQALNAAVLVQAKLSYLPNLRKADQDYRALADGGLTAKLTDRVAFKSTVALAYDSQPALVAPLNKSGVAVAGVLPVAALKTDVSWTSLLMITLL